MKKYVCSLLTLAFIATVAINAGAQTVTRNVSGYTGIECNGPFSISIKIDGTEGVKLDVDANIIDDIKTEVENGVLKVGFKSRWKNHGNIQRANIYITAKSLSYLTNGGSGNVVLDGTIAGEHAKVALSGSGNLKASVKSATLDLGVSGSGGIYINGSTGMADIHINGSGGINGKALKTEMVKARISGSGGIDVAVSKTISARISGSGSIRYSGDATIADTHYSGSGRVSKVD